MENAPTRGAPTLLLVPTELEAQLLAAEGGFEPGLAIEVVCGFGPVAAAARTAHALTTLRPARVLLLGIAGTYQGEHLPVGSAALFDAVAVDGIGVGEGESSIPPSALGFPQWPGGLGTSAAPIEDRLALVRPAAFAGRDPEPALLLSACAASATAAQAAARRRRFRGVLAEDMEGFGVAVACALAGVPLSIVRGIANEVGDRDHGRWRIPAALAAARRLALEVLRAR